MLADKQFVVLRHNNGKYTIAADYGNAVWGAATYEVVGYYNTRGLAQQAIRDDRQARANEAAQ